MKESEDMFGLRTMFGEDITQLYSKDVISIIDREYNLKRMFFTEEDVSEYLGIPVETVNQYINSGKYLNDTILIKGNLGEMVEFLWNEIEEKKTTFTK